MQGLLLMTVLRVMVIFTGSVTTMIAASDAPHDGLVGYWPLLSDCRDYSGHGLHGKDNGLLFAPGMGAEFDGRKAWSEVPHAPGLPVGTGDFTIAVWINTDKAHDDALGDIVTKYDPARRKGINLSLLNLTGVTSSHSNYRNLHFGMDDGAGEMKWVDCGRPGNSLFVCALAVYDGALYAGTFETGAHEAGHVYRWEGGSRWTDCGAPAKCNAVGGLAVFNGKLYAGVARYRARGSALPDSPNEHPGGKIYRYEGGTAWADCGRLGDADTAWGMVVHQGALYAIPIYHQGVWRYDSDQTWTYCGTPGVRLMALGVFDDRLYGAGNEGNKQGGVYRYEGGVSWSPCGSQAGVDQVYSFATHCGRMHVGTWPDAAVFRNDSGSSWTSCGRLGEEKEVMAMAVYNGKLYAGSLPLAQVYRYDGETYWTLTGRLDFTPDVTYRRAWSMAVYQGKLFCGTLPSGRVYTLEAGQNVTYDRALKRGWQHIAAIRRGNRLELHIDAQSAAVSSNGNTALDVSNTAPLRIGFGSHDYFNGHMREVRLYSRALDAPEIAALAGR